MKNNASLAYSLLLIIGDFLAVTAAFIVAYILRVKVDERSLIVQIAALDYVRAVITVLPLWIVVHAFIGLYSQEVFEKRFSELGRLVVGSFMGILVVIGYDFVSDTELFPARLVPVYGLVLSLGFLVLFRTIVKIIRRVLFRYGIGISNVVIVGNTEASTNMAEAVRNTKNTGQKILCIVGRDVRGFKHYPDFSKAVGQLRRPIHAIIQTELYGDQDKNNEILRYAHEHHASYRFVPGNTDLFVGNITVDLYAGLPVVAVHQTALIGWGRIVKRLFDLVVSVTLIIILSPVMLFIAVIAKLFDPKGSVFFRQMRLTRYNREFRVFKFRTQYSKYDGTTPEQAFEKMGKPELAKRYRTNGDFLDADPRVTRFGKFLRSTSLDELPQLFNVAKGDISLVGPRALIAQELNAYEKRHAILSVKSGMTGLAQISGRRDIDFDERRRLDIYYVQNWSFWNDITILLKTIRAILGGIGAR
jgi:exopolysaccharide biosynthesis polyprenyl glycosylphosphotransferase